LSVAGGFCAAADISTLIVEI
jgi:hypothetical protein